MSPSPVIVDINMPGNGLQTAWIALAGVLIGALITSGFNFWLARRQERADKATDARAVRVAARLIDDEFLGAEVAAAGAIQKKKWWLPSIRFSLDGWQQYREVIAGRLSAADWRAVMVAAMAVGHLQETREAERGVQLQRLSADPNFATELAEAERFGTDIVDPTPPMPDGIAEVLEPMLKDVRAGRTALAVLTED